MTNNYKEEVNKGLSFVERFLKIRVSLKIALPILTKFFNYHKKIYAEDLEKLDLIVCKGCNKETFKSIRINLNSTFSMLSYHQDLIYNLYSHYLNQNFHNEHINIKAKLFSQKLEELDDMLARRMQPGPAALGEEPLQLILVRELRYQDDITSEIISKSDETYELFNEFHSELEKFKKEKFFRFFI